MKYAEGGRRNRVLIVTRADGRRRYIRSVAAATCPEPCPQLGISYPGELDSTGRTGAKLALLSAQESKW